MNSLTVLCSGARQRRRRPEQSGGDHQGKGSGCFGVDCDLRECVSVFDTQVTVEKCVCFIPHYRVFVSSSYRFIDYVICGIQFPGPAEDIRIWMGCLHHLLSIHHMSVIRSRVVNSFKFSSSASVQRWILAVSYEEWEERAPELMLAPADLCGRWLDLDLLPSPAAP